VTAHIVTSDVQTWLESTKLSVASIEPGLEGQMASEVLGRLAETFSAYTPLWVDSTTTPAIVKQIIAMYYASWIFDRSYAEVVTNEAQVSYGATIRGWAMKLLNDVITGGVIIPELGSGSAATGPIFYPNDVSSTWDAWRANTDCNDNSLGPAKFGMGMRF
jgi:hypothetical protein